MECTDDTDEVNNIIEPYSKFYVKLDGTLESNENDENITGSNNYGSTNLHHTHPHIFQHQSSIVSTASVQTVLHQNQINSHNNLNCALVNGNSSCSSINSSFGQTQHVEEILKVADVADLLHPQYTIITGGRSNDGCPIIHFPDHNNFHQLNDEEYQNLVLYLTSVPSLQEIDAGFHIIIDRRKDRWASVKACLFKISVYFPGNIQVVYVIRPSGFLQKAISEVSSKFFKDEFKFRLVVCASIEDLHEHISKSQLTSDLGGTLGYSHYEWIQQRISLEKFSYRTGQVSLNLDTFIRSIRDTEFPNSVETTKKLLDEQGSEYEKLKDEILTTAKHGENLLNDFKTKDEGGKEFAERTGNISTIESAGNLNENKNNFDDSRDYRRLLVQLEETERRFDEFWNIHLNKLKQCLELRRFEQDFRELQVNFDAHLKKIAEMTEIGENVSRVDDLIRELKLFQKMCQSGVERAEEVIATGQTLVNARGACPKELVQPKCDELSRVCEMVTQRLAKRLETLAKNRELMERVEKANKWCTKGVELLSSQRIEKCSTSAEYSEQSLQEIQNFIASAADFKLSSPREFKNIFLESTTPETKAIVTQLLQRIDDVSLMCDKRITTLKQFTLKPPRPVQTVTPEPAVPLQPPGGAPHLFRQRKHNQKAQENCVKIFIPSPTSATEMSPTVTVNHTKPMSISSYDSDLDYGYYEKIPEKIYTTAAGDPSTSGILTSSAMVNETIKSKTTEKLSSIIDVPIKLGCDGAIFWNNCYYYDDKYDCSQCCHIDIADQKDEKFVCVCGAEEVDGTESRPRSVEGSLDSGVLICGDNGSSPDSDNSSSNPQSQIDIESRKLKRGHVLAELLETERVYVAEMGSILKGYRDQMLSEELAPLVPPGLQGKEDILFGNLHELYTFHSEIFLKDLENCISATELVALCFVQRRETFYRLYSYYCQNIPRSERLRETLVDTHLFLQECQKRLGHKLPLAAYLLKPVQRITKYQLLLKDLLRFSDNGACGRELQKALDCMLIVLKCVNDSMHQIAITGFPADLSQQGELLMQDSFQLWTDSKKDLRLRLKTQQRHIFLYQKALLFCKPASKTGHNKSTYQFKHFLKMSQIGLTESVRGDPKRFEIWLQGRQEVHTIQATTVEIKNKWVSEIKRVLLNQLEELKGEKIKQYGLNHKPLRQTASWDMPLTTHSAPYRTMSCDTSDTNVSNRNSIISEDIPLPITGISSSSSDHDNQSSDYSNSEDEFAAVEEVGTPGSRFISLADYCAMGHSEVSMKDGDTIELLKVGCAGWWFVKVLGSNLEGWAPAAYLEPINKKSTRCSSRNQDRLTEH